VVVEMKTDREEEEVCLWTERASGLVWLHGCVSEVSKGFVVDPPFLLIAHPVLTRSSLNDFFSGCVKHCT